MTFNRERQLMWHDKHEAMRPRFERAREYLERLLDATDSSERAMSEETTRLHLEARGWLAARCPADEAPEVRP